MRNEIEMLNNKLKDWFWKILLLTHEVMELLGLLDVEVSVVLVEVVEVEVPEFVEDDDRTVIVKFWDIVCDS